MRRCHYCGGKLGLIVHRKWRLRFCKLACKKSYEYRQSQQIRHRRRWLNTSVLKSALEGAFYRYHAARERVGYRPLALNPIYNPFEACFAPAARFGRSSIFRAAIGYLPPARAELESFPSLSSSPIMLGMRNLFLALSGAGVGILRCASTHVAEYFCQLLAPSVEISLLGDVAAIQGIGIRLVRDGRAIPDNDNGPARTHRSDQLHGVPDALRFLRLHHGWP
jgi:cellulose synthase/poly-beta-1,6-N-acetylglucosamine synthase-like glycosyltransferase